MALMLHVGRDIRFSRDAGPLLKPLLYLFRFSNVSDVPNEKSLEVISFKALSLGGVGRD
jgi:hypothetical protein